MSELNKKDLLAKLVDLGAPVAYELDGIGTIYIKKLSVGELASLSKYGDDTVKATLQIVAYSVCDENGKRLFGDADLPQLGKMHKDTLKELSDAIGEINGFDKDQDHLKKD